MNYWKDDATHFLTYEDPETGYEDLLDCIPLGRTAGGTMEVAVFSDHIESWTVEIVNSGRVLSVEKVVSNIMGKVVNDLVLLDSRNDESAH